MNKQGEINEIPITLYNPLLPPNTYTNSDNPNYWKNKMPYKGYWQQDVHYSIQAELFDSIDVIHANQIITYTNNSPDELNEVFFHLYQNAFQPESYLLIPLYFSGWGL